MRITDIIIHDLRESDFEYEVEVGTCDLCMSVELHNDLILEFSYTNADTGETVRTEEVVEQQDYGWFSSPFESVHNIAHFAQWLKNYTHENVIERGRLESWVSVFARLILEYRKDDEDIHISLSPFMDDYYN